MRLEDGEKFWEITLDGTTVHTRHGRVGTDGRATPGVTLETEEKAAKDYGRRLAERQKKGFEVVTPEVVEPINAELEQAIMDDPGDAGRLLVYADWLQGQSHPRGELAALQHRRAEPAPGDESATLSKAEEKLLDKYPGLAPRKFGEMVRKARPKGGSEHGLSSAVWENGFIASARVARSSLKPPYTVRELVAELLAHPAARFLRELKLGPLNPAGAASFNYGEVLQEIIWARPRALRTLSMVDLPPDAAELAFSDLGDLSLLYRELPYLEQLTLAGRSLALGSIALPRLKRLRVGTSEAGVLLSLAKGSLPSLEALTVESGGETVDEKAFDELVSASWPKLTSLAVLRTGNTDALTALLTGSALLGRLTRLDLSGGQLTDAGAKALAPKVSHLARLDVSNNLLTERGTDALSGACAELVLGPQRSASRVTLTDRDIARFAPDPGALARARSVAKTPQWPTLARDGKTYWGTCQGSELYEVYLTVPGLDSGCSCPSGTRPCKHSIALALIVASGWTFKDEKLPRGLMGRASTGPRYGNGWE